MTNEEAIYQIDNYALREEENPAKLREAMEVAVEALEKQIPKKPIYETRSLENEKILGSWCPSCKRPLSRTTEQHHCKCGQAIDWSEDI